MHIAGLSHPSVQGLRPQVTIGPANQLLLNEKEARKKVSLEEDDDIVVLEKSNILMLGPTGSGKKIFCFSRVIMVVLLKVGLEPAEFVL